MYKTNCPYTFFSGDIFKNIEEYPLNVVNFNLPGNYTVNVPSDSTLLSVTMTGGSGADGISKKGGLGASIVNYFFKVKPCSIINITVGSKGINNQNGGSSSIEIDGIIYSVGGGFSAELGGGNGIVSKALKKESQKSKDPPSYDIVSSPNGIGNVKWFNSSKGYGFRNVGNMSNGTGDGNVSFIFYSKS
jgi:hypothetical protein